jgi:hypothetical protein
MDVWVIDDDLLVHEAKRKLIGRVKIPLLSLPFIPARNEYFLECGRHALIILPRFGSHACISRSWCHPCKRVQRVGAVHLV